MTLKNVLKRYQAYVQGGAILNQATKWIEAGKITPLVDPRKFTLATAQAAHEAIEKSSAIGKIVIDIE